MARYGTFKYGEKLYGATPAPDVDLLWAFQVDWRGDGSFSVPGAPNNEAGRMSGLTTKRGHYNILGEEGLNPFEVGEAVVILDNSDGKYDPYDTSSPLYPYVAPGKYVRMWVRSQSEDDVYGIMSGIISDIQPIKDGPTHKVRIVVKDGLQWMEDRTINIGLTQGGTKSFVVTYFTDEMDWPSTEWPLDISTDGTSIVYWWCWNQNAWAAMKEFNQAEWARTFHNRDGEFSWRPRDYGYERTITLHQSELSEDVGRQQPWETVRNKVRVVAHPKMLDDVDAILWELQSVPAILDGETLYIEGLFKYQHWTPCGAAVSFDFAVNVQADEGGAWLTGDCVLDHDPDIGEGCRLWLTNNSGQDGYVTLLKATGDAIYAPDIDIREAEDTDSQAEYGPRTLEVTSRWVEYTDDAQELADWLLTYFKDPTMHPIIQLMAHQPHNQFYPDLYDRVVLNVPYAGIRHVFRIGMIEHEWLSPNGTDVKTTMRLEPYMQEGIDTRDDAEHGCLLTRNAVQSIPNDTDTEIAWNNDIYDTDGYHDGADTFITIPEGLGGYYRIYTDIQWDANATGFRYVHIQNAHAFARNPSPGAADYTQRVETTVKLDVGDVVRVLVYQDSGGALDVNRQNQPYTPLFGVQFLGA